MSWIGWLILAALLVCVPIWAARGALEFWHWLLDNFTDPDSPRRRRSPYRRRDRLAVERERQANTVRNSSSHTARIPMGAMMASRFHPLAPFAHLARKLVAGKHFDYWVRCALEESNPTKKVTYCSKAVELNPTYVPAWGLKGTTLLEMAQYAQAAECFEKVLALAPSPLAWYRNGLCLYHLRRFDEAIQCFNKTLATCASTDRTLSDDAARHKALAQTELRASEAGSAP